MWAVSFVFTASSLHHWSPSSGALCPSPWWPVPQAETKRCSLGAVLMLLLGQRYYCCMAGGLWGVKWVPKSSGWWECPVCELVWNQALAWQECREAVPHPGCWAPLHTLKSIGVMGSMGTQHCCAFTLKSQEHACVLSLSYFLCSLFLPLE